MKGNPVRGGQYVFRGFSLLSEKSIRPFIIVPLIINIVLFSAALYLLFSHLPQWIDSWLALLPSFFEFLTFILYPLFILTSALIIYYSFSIVANIIAAPFNGILSEKVEKLIANREVEEGGWGELLALIPRSIGRELSKLMYYLPRVIFLLILSFIPGLNLLAPFLWFLFGAWMMAVQYCDYPMDNNNVSFKDMRLLLKRQRLTSIGFGTLVQLGMMVPVLNFIMMPVAVIGATLYWIDEHADQI